MLNNPLSMHMEAYAGTCAPGQLQEQMLVRGTHAKVGLTQRVQRPNQRDANRVGPLHRITIKQWAALRYKICRPTCVQFLLKRNVVWAHPAKQWR